VAWRQLFSRFDPRRLNSPLAGGWLAGWLGNAGERQAARYLKGKGFRVIARRYRTHLGEIDLVAEDGACVVFVEVKTRRSEEAGQPFEAVDRRKQEQLTRLALAWLKRKGWLERSARFDVVSIVWRAGAAKPEITHYRNAFEPVGRGQLYS
jgi:putative endonuclease